MNRLGLLPILLLAAVVPLSNDQLARVETARDDRDHREEALAALLENVSAWRAGLGDVAIRLEPDVDALIVDPAAHRGELCLLLGQVQQQTPLERPFENAIEWFVRDDQGRPMAVYLPAADAAAFRDGQRISMPARFYKRLTYTDREGVQRACAAFVGAGPALVDAGAPAPVQRLVLLGVGLAVLLALFLVALLSARAARRPKRPLSSPPAPEPEGEGNRLPDDPVEALEELGRRASGDHDVQ
jgi:hypothetical protein